MLTRIFILNKLKELTVENVLLAGLTFGSKYENFCYFFVDLFGGVVDKEIRQFELNLE